MSRSSFCTAGKSLLTTAPFRLIDSIVIAGSILVSGFLQMMLELLFSITSALTHSTHLLRSG